MSMKSCLRGMDVFLASNVAYLSSCSNNQFIVACSLDTRRLPVERCGGQAKTQILDISRISFAIILFYVFVDK